MKIYIYRVGADYDSHGGIYWSLREHSPKDLAAIISRYEDERKKVSKNRGLDSDERDGQIKAIVARFSEETGLHRIVPIEVVGGRDLCYDIPFWIWMEEDDLIEV